MKTLCLLLLLNFTHNSIFIRRVSTSDPVISELKKNKEAIDKRLLKDKKHLFVFVKVKGKKELVGIKNEKNTKWPAEELTEVSYNVFKDSIGKVVMIAKMPFSESGDWDVSYVYYFDSFGKIFAFERISGFFNSICTDDAAHETLARYFDKNLKQINQTYKLTDSKKKPLNKLKCTFPYNFAYEIYPSVEECLKAYNIKL
jgi:hypothetical protein